MAEYKGSGGKVIIGTGPGDDMEATGWTMNTTVDLAEVTKLGDTAKTYVTGFTDWTATVDVIMQTVTDILGTFNVAKASINLFINDSNYFEADGFVTGVSPIVSTGDAAKATLTIVGTDGTANMTFN